MYVAVTYVDTGIKLYTPGEIIEEDPNAEWHLKVNAIRPLAEAPSPTAAGILYEEAVDEPAEQDTDALKEANDIDDFEVSAEIDIMDGIVKSGSGSASGRKARTTSSKKAPKGGKST